MSKRNTIKKTAALCMSVALTFGATGCTFLLTDNDLDLKQVVATVDITDTLTAAGNEFAAQANDVDKLIDAGVLATDVYKRDLVAYFISVGAEYVNNYGMTYKQTFETLMDDLVNQKILTQYAVAYYLKNGFTNEDGTKTPATADACLAYVNAAINGAEGRQKQLYQENKTALAMEYFLTENGADKEDYFETVYYFQQSINSALDEAEANYIKADDEEHDHGEAQTKPTNVDAFEDEFVPMKGDKLDYGVYTGRNAVSSCGTYEKVEGSTATTRKQAYNVFLSNLQSYGLIKDGEDTASFTELDYYYIELSTSLAKSVANKYFTELQDQVIDSLKENDYKAVKDKYNEILSAQQTAYENKPADFEASLSALSDTNFALYGYENFGFVYNILLPFNAAQEQAYAAAKNMGLSKEQLFQARKTLLTQIEATDKRDTWFSEHSHADYSYKVTQSEANTNYFGDATVEGDEDKAFGYLFFKDNMQKTEQYKALDHYLGKYAYNGTAKKADGEWTFTPNKLTVDGFIDEMNAYIKFASGATVDGVDLVDNWKEKKVAPKAAYDNPYTDSDGKVNYENFIYYEGKVELTETPKAKDFFNKDTQFYKAASAVNELMFAYSTDPGALNTYMGYAVSPYKTSFVPEFEAAAQYAIRKGVGTYVVAPSDYGWHIIFVTFKFGAGEVYEGGFVPADVDVEGTFSNLFYTAMEDTSATNYATERQSVILNDYKDSATLFERRYKDLLNLD